MKIGGTLKYIRQFVVERRQNDVAKSIGISQTYLSQIESGSKTPAQETLELICKEYRVPLSIVIWQSLETKDVDKSKRVAFARIKPIVDDLLSGFLTNNYGQ